MDLFERDDHFVLRADLPGVSEEDVKVELEDSTLTVSGERKADHEVEGEGYYRVERAFGAFSRVLHLPQGVQADGIRRPSTTASRGPHPQARAAQAAPDRDRRCASRKTIEAGEELSSTAPASSLPGLAWGGR